MKFSSFLIFTAAGLALAAPIDPVNTEKKLTIEPVAVAKRQTSLDPIVDAAHGKLPVPIKRATPSVSSLDALTGAVPGGLPVGKRQLEGLLPTSTSKGDGSETAEEPKEPKMPKEPKEPKEPSSVEDGKTEISNGEEESTGSAGSSLGGLPIGKRQLDGITKMLSPKPADPAEPEAAPADEAAASDAPADAPEEAEEPKEGEEAPKEGDAAAPAEEDSPTDPSALAGILKRQLGDLTKGLMPSSDSEDTKDAEGDADAEDAPAAEEQPADEAAPAEDKTAEETAPAKNATEPAPAKKESLLGSLGL
jgi:hypothetical protein